MKLAKMYNFRPAKVSEITKEMLHHKLVTKQTSKDGVMVQKVLLDSFRTIQI